MRELRKTFAFVFLGAIPVLAIACSEQPHDQAPAAVSAPDRGVASAPPLRGCTDYWEMGLPVGYMPKVKPKTRLNIRKAPTTQSEIVGKVSPDDTLSVQKRCEGWLHLAQESVTNRRGEVERWLGGWVSSRYVCAPKSAREIAQGFAATASDVRDAMHPVIRTIFSNAAQAQRELGVPDC